MRRFIEKEGNGWRCGEKNVVELESGKEYVLTQPKTLFSEDTYSIKRAVCCQNVSVLDVPEKDFYVYEISYMEDGYTLRIVIVDEETVEGLIKNHASAFLRGNAGKVLVEHLKEGEIWKRTFWLHQYATLTMKNLKLLSFSKKTTSMSKRQIFLSLR